MEDDRVLPGDFNDGNRAFLQAFMARGTLTLREAQPIIAGIFTAQGRQFEPDQVTSEHMASFIGAAAEAVSHFDYEVRSTMHQKLKQRLWAIVNTTSDPQTQLATLHTPDEIAFVKRVLDGMFEKYNTPRMEVMCLDEMQANKLRSVPRVVNEEDVDDGEGAESQTQLKGLKPSEAEAMMRSMVEAGWFERSPEGLYGLSPRALLELRGWLIEAYNDPDAEPDEWQRIKMCEACKEIVTVGQRCADRDCNIRLHDICEDAFWRTRREKKCPKCETPWSGKHFVGERAVTETEAYQRGRRRSGKGRSSNLMEQIMGNDENEEDENGFIEEE
ncbi:Nse1 non-SMC component of SMC5-6 complex-domain-containing protein [Pseudomassariella vexata]|uniref:Non-structural maintenance of chromosomes element 1 homolog n=1 Tax=Pseudomassariella vexata TaxID=1141098 RepID=A0A1Y2E0H1_9PEZI|nr:Nse1 non-SMC component of SMC5-6 complex-domain-containing protein [Pseudomassariella vexata]ORY65033.1 Nse1 non-SMC component of SMC5-6 complex-domain-containing protein [Pseudomassariella vexata]